MNRRMNRKNLDPGLNFFNMILIYYMERIKPLFKINQMNIDSRIEIDLN